MNRQNLQLETIYNHLQHTFFKPDRSNILSINEYRAIVENLHELVMVTQPDGKISYLSPACGAVLGYQPQDLIGRQPWIIHPEDLLKIQEAHSRALRGESGSDFEYRINTKNGDTKWISHSWKAVMDNGKLKMIISLIRDITERKKTEQEAVAAKEQLERILGATRTGIDIIDSNFVVRYIDREWQKVLGPYQGRKCFEYFMGRTAPCPTCGIPKALETKKAVVTEEYLEKEKRHIQVTTTPFCADDGTWFVSELNIDITERKKMEETLCESERRYRGIFEDSKDAIVITTYDGRFMDVNQAAIKLFGYSKEELIKLDVNKLYVNPKDRQTFQHKTEQYGSVNNFEVRLRKKKGTEMDCLFTSNLRRTTEGKVIGYQSIIRDVTAQKQAEERVKKSLEQSGRIIEGTIKAMAKAVEMRDPYTAGHQRRVSRLACIIAKKMKLQPEEIEGVRVAGILHDIGKIYVPSEILTMPRKLNQMEMNLVKEHTRVGYEILKAEEFPWPIAKIVLQHHERINGSGYPAGLFKKQIMLEARILAVADVVEAMASHRPYRPRLGIEKALEEVERNRGVLYDPDVVDACNQFFSSRKSNLHF